MRTEYFLRQLYAQQNPGRLNLTFSPQPIDKPKTTFAKQDWALPNLSDFGELRKNVVIEGKQPSTVTVAARFEIQNAKRMSGEGWAQIGMTGRELGGSPDRPPVDLIPGPPPGAPMRRLNVKWAFSKNPELRYLEFAQAGDPVVQ